ncbi:uncharacterized protein VP01_3682g1 [Puccinia sorghi]|uniref:HAT C-terminal dimerisation domain-containing protein n=1 Tax=Puccinia sorghi TaxID=27349 RepID=A0A0L6UUA4_9BASI|nr:uncharacterized protein VP01_3682g1 [Puccinia sorghi]
MGMMRVRAKTAKRLTTIDWGRGGSDWVRISAGPRAVPEASASASALVPPGGYPRTISGHGYALHRNARLCITPGSGKKKGEPCGVLLSRDSTSSTKSMSEHLKRVHHMIPPNQDQTNQLLLPNLMKRQRAEHFPIVTAELLRQAIGYLVAEADLPFSIVERPSFVHLLELLNPQTANMDFSHKSIKNVID